MHQNVHWIIWLVYVTHGKSRHAHLRIVQYTEQTTASLCRPLLILEKLLKKYTLVILNIVWCYISFELLLYTICFFNMQILFILIFCIFAERILRLINCPNISFFRAFVSNYGWHIVT